MNDQLDIMVTVACQARCPFCVQEATFRPPMAAEECFLRGVRQHVQEFHALGGRKIVITGGEPLLSQDRVFGVLRVLREIGQFNLTALYTNGEYLPSLDADGSTMAERLARAGLGCVNLSVHHFDDAINNRIFGRSAKPATSDVVTVMRQAQLPFRFNLVLQKGGIDDLAKLDDFVRWAFALGAKDLYVREIFRFAFDRPISRSRFDPLTYCQTNHVSAAPLIEQLERHPHYRLLRTETADLRDKTEHTFLHLPTSREVFVSSLAVGTEDQVGLPYLIVMPNGMLYRGWLGPKDQIRSIRSVSERVPCPTRS